MITVGAGTLRFGILNMRKALAAFAELWCVQYMLACQTVSSSNPVSLVLRSDSAEVTVARGVTKIPFLLVNITEKAFRAGGCLPQLQKKVNEKWVTADFGTVLGCEGGLLEPGATSRDTLPVFTTNLVNNLQGVNSIDGVYRLRWTFVEGKDREARRARKVEAVSNEFRMVFRPPSK